MFRAAFTSRSNDAPHVQRKRSDEPNLGLIFPHKPHVLLVYCSPQINTLHSGVRAAFCNLRSNLQHSISVLLKKMNLSETAPRELMVEHAQEYLALKKELTDVNEQTAALRKSVKAAEKSLVAEMALNKIEEFEVDGVKLTRARGLKTGEI